MGKKTGKRGFDTCWRCRCSLMPENGYKGGVGMFKVKYKNPEWYPHLVVHENGDIPVFMCESCSEILKGA
jgi:hypothetical protein